MYIASGRALDVVGHLDRWSFVNFFWAFRGGCRPSSWPLFVGCHLDNRSFKAADFDHLCIVLEFWKAVGGGGLFGL